MSWPAPAGKPLVYSILCWIAKGVSWTWSHVPQGWKDILQHVHQVLSLLVLLVKLETPSLTGKLRKLCIFLKWWITQKQKLWKVRDSKKFILQAGCLWIQLVNMFLAYFQNVYITISRKSSLPLKKACNLAVTPHSPQFLAPGNHYSVFVSTDLPILDISHKWNHAACDFSQGFFHLLCFPGPSMLKHMLVLHFIL